MIARHTHGSSLHTTRPVILSGAGLPTENTWKLIDNTGLELEALKVLVVTGSMQHVLS